MISKKADDRVTNTIHLQSIKHGGSHEEDCFYVFIGGDITFLYSG